MSAYDKLCIVSFLCFFLFCVYILIVCVDGNGELLYCGEVYNNELKSYVVFNEYHQ